MLNFSQHADKNYEQSLGAVRHNILAMGAQVRHLIELSEHAVITGEAQVDEAKTLDRDVNALELAVERDVMASLSRFHSFFEELRFLTGAIKIAAALERMGDMAKNTIKRMKKLGGAMEPETAGTYRAMFAEVYRILDGSMRLLDAFDAEVAIELHRFDDNVDRLYKQLLNAARLSDAKDEDARNRLSHQLFIAKNVERMADHAASIVRNLYMVNTNQALPQ